jgi:uncharacterized protein (TIGR00290 family)
VKKEKVLLSWAGGKESAVSLFELKSPEFKIKGLCTVASEPDFRLPKSGIKLDHVIKQAESLEMPLRKIIVGSHEGLGLTSKIHEEELEAFKKEGGQGIAFGDQSSNDLKTAHELLCQRTALSAFFPVWKWKKEEVLRVFLGLGFKAIVSAVDSKKLPPTFVGRLFDQEFVDSLPPSVDPCGEDGAFHTFVFDGPFFQRRIELKPKDRFERAGMLCQNFE